MSILGILNSDATKLWGKTGFHASQTASVFASDLSRRIASSSAASVDDAGTESAQMAPEKQQQLAKLESALGGSVNYLTDKFGEKAGTAMMALIYKGIGNKDITEESLGNAFLDVTRFVDKNFGIQAGDEFMAHLNGSLNDSLNNFFENGLSEKFIAVTTYAGGQAASSDPGATVDEMYVQSILDMLEEARISNDNETKNPYFKEVPDDKLSGVLQDTFI